MSYPEAAHRLVSASQHRVSQSEFAGREARALILRTLELTQSTRNLISRSDRAIVRFQTLGRHKGCVLG